MATISISRDELMAKLLEAKAKADKEDEKAADKHKREETAALVAFRAAIREALKWDYETAKRRYMRVQLDRTPSCPSRVARPIELAIAQVKMDNRKGPYRLSHVSDWYKAASWLPASDRPKESVCS
jgi:hypothetical protein